MNARRLHSICRALRSPLGALALFLACGGCAGVSYRTIDSPEADRNATGLRYYDSSPYLLVQTDGKGGLKSELQYLPDLTKKRQASPYAFLSSNNVTLTFVNGVAMETSSDADATAVPVAVVGALKDLGNAALKAAAFDRTDGGAQTPASVPSGAPRVYLFKIVKRDFVDPKDGSRKREWGLVGASGDPVKYQ